MQQRSRSSEPWLSPKNPGEGMLSAEDWVAVAAATGLTPREMQVAILLFEGHSREATAGRLKLSLRTVRKHLESLYAKLQVDDRMGLALRIVRVHQALADNQEHPSSE